MHVSFYLFLPPFFVFAAANDSWFLDWSWGYGHYHHNPHLPHFHLHDPPQRSVCDKLVSWMDVLAHNNSYSCQPLPTDIHGEK